MKIKKAIACMMACVTVLGTGAMPVLADTDTDWEVGIEDATTGTTRDTVVTFAEESHFTVTIPKAIQLTREQAEIGSDYNVTVTGSVDIGQVVSVAPHDAVTDVDGVNFYMTDTKGKDQVAATVTQAETEWKEAEGEILETGVSKTGKISANDLSAGDWSGTLTFDIGLTTA